MIINKEALLQSAMIGYNIDVECKSGQKISGKIRAVSDQYIELDMENAIQKIIWEDVLVLERPNNIGMDHSQSSILWWRKQRNLANNLKYSLGICYRALFDQIAKRTNNIIMKSIFENRNSRKLLYIEKKEEVQFLHSLNIIFKHINISREEKCSARAIIYLASKDYAKGIKMLIEEVSAEEVSDTVSLLPLICYYQDMGDSVAAFYWLSCYYENLENILHIKDHWWNYLLRSVSFDYYDDLIPQLYDLFDSSPRLAVKSLAFLFFAKNDMYKGNLLYNEAVKESGFMMKEQFNIALNSLQYGVLYDEHFSYYARYHRCIEIILDEKRNLYQEYESDDGLHGFVYEFIPGQGYCKIIGCDLLSYFMHFDDCSVVDANNTKNIKNKLQREICSLAPIEEEMPVCVEFCRISNLNMKKSYAVSRAELSSQI